MVPSLQSAGVCSSRHVPVKPWPCSPLYRSRKAKGLESVRPLALMVGSSEGVPWRLFVGPHPHFP